MSQWYICSDCYALGRMDELINQSCPVCGGQLLPTNPPSFIMAGKAKYVFDKLNELTEHINELQNENEIRIKKFQLETPLPDLYVQCIMAKICDIDDCPHSKPHEPELFDTTTCRHGTRCMIFNTRCIPFPEKIE